jgi:hypothetical protein
MRARRLRHTPNRPFAASLSRSRCRRERPPGAGVAGPPRGCQTRHPKWRGQPERGTAPPGGLGSMGIGHRQGSGSPRRRRAPSSSVSSAFRDRRLDRASPAHARGESTGAEKAAGAEADGELWGGAGEQSERGQGRERQQPRAELRSQASGVQRAAASSGRCFGCWFSVQPFGSRIRLRVGSVSADMLHQAPAKERPFADHDFAGPLIAGRAITANEPGATSRWNGVLGAFHARSRPEIDGTRGITPPAAPAPILSMDKPPRPRAHRYHGADGRNRGPQPNVLASGIACRWERTVVKRRRRNQSAAQGRPEREDLCWLGRGIGGRRQPARFFPTTIIPVTMRPPPPRAHMTQKNGRGGGGGGGGGGFPGRAPAPGWSGEGGKKGCGGAAGGGSALSAAGVGGGGVIGWGRTGRRVFRSHVSGPKARRDKKRHRRRLEAGGKVGGGRGRLERGATRGLGKGERGITGRDKKDQREQARGLRRPIFAVFFFNASIFLPGGGAARVARSMPLPRLVGAK